jgi:multiple sugar transport system substrate-binding protein
MRYLLKASALALTVSLATAASPAWADFWSDAGAKFKGVTLHGVTESTPPSNYIKDILAPEFEKKTGIKVEIETTSWDQMYDKAIKDMEAKTGIYDMVYIEQDIIYSYLSRDFLVDVTKTLKDHPDLKAPTYDDKNFTTFADYFKARRRSLRHSDGSLHQGLPLSQGPLRRSEDPGSLQEGNRQGPETGQDA